MRCTSFWGLRRRRAYGCHCIINFPSRNEHKMHLKKTDFQTVKPLCSNPFCKWFGRGFRYLNTFSEGIWSTREERFLVFLCGKALNWRASWTHEFQGDVCCIGLDLDLCLFTRRSRRFKEHFPYRVFRKNTSRKDRGGRLPFMGRASVDSCPQVFFLRSSIGHFWTMRSMVQKEVFTNNTESLKLHSVYNLQIFRMAGCQDPGK